MLAAFVMKVDSLSVEKGRFDVTRDDIEKKLGMSFSTARSFLMSRFEAGQLERRKVGPTKSWARSVGYEWRWKK
jgi:predicted transcriptional regulator